MPIIKKTRGFTLVELLIALVINIFLLAGLIDIFVANLEHYRKILNANMLQEQLQSAIYFMTNEIRRAGYSALATNDIGSGQNNNAFMTTSTDITINSTNNCILFTYDRTGTGSLPAINANIDDERYGYRLSNNILQTRPPGALFSCTAITSNWENMIDPNVITITALSFTLNTTTLSATNGQLLVRSVDISITGQLTSNSAVVKTITSHVRVRNDEYVP
jgi:type II secretory pathway component PulJ